MATRLVFVHGRAQEGKDAQKLKDSWIASLRKGMAKSGLELPVVESDIRFPYYGDALFDRVEDKKPAEQMAEVIMRGAADGAAAFRAFMHAVVADAVAQLGISEDDIDETSDETVIRRGIANWEWVQRALATIDRKIPGASGKSIALATEDVYKYLKKDSIARVIDDGVSAAMADDTPIVVVSHSLGTVVAYKMLAKLAAGRRWKVPLFVTLGSPLGITAIRDGFAPIGHPPMVGRWFNAMDPRDVVALYPLDRANFEIDPEIENKTDVDNFTDNRHGIAGYLEDAVVARRIHEALEKK